MVIADESHIIFTPNFNESFSKIRKEVVTLSFSATPYKTYINKRKGYVPVWAGRTMHYTHPDNLNPDGTFKNVVFQDNKKELLENKESCPVKAIAATSTLDFESQVEMNSNGEYDFESIKEFEEKNWEHICKDFIDTYKKFPELQVRNKIMVACPPSIEKTKEAALLFAQETGETTATVTSGNYFLYRKDENEKVVEQKLTKEEVLSRFKQGEIKFLFSISQLKEGFDEPAVDAVMMMNFTKSVSDYIQILGRGRRFDKSKEDMIVVDYLPNKYSKMNPLVASVALGEVVPLINIEQNHFEHETTNNEILADNNEDQIEDLNLEDESKSIIKQNYFETIKGLYVPIGEAIEIIRKQVMEKLGSKNIKLSNTEIKKFIDLQIQKGLSEGEDILKLVTNENMDLNLENKNYLNNAYVNQLDVYVSIPELIARDGIENLTTGVDNNHIRETETGTKGLKVAESVAKLKLKIDEENWLKITEVLESGNRIDRSDPKLFSMYSNQIYDKKLSRSVGFLKYEKRIFKALKNIELNEAKSNLDQWTQIEEILKNGRLPLYSELVLYTRLKGLVKLNQHKDFAKTELGMSIIEKYNEVVKSKESIINPDWIEIHNILQTGNKPHSRNQTNLHRKLNTFLNGSQYFDFAKTDLGEEILSLCEKMGYQTFRTKEIDKNIELQKKD
jgi:superfamily II DNA or RNA helicase